MKRVDMSFIPKNVRELGLIERFRAAGLKHVASGKVRETFELPDHPEFLLIYATDRVSIFDIVLDARVPGKGEILVASTVHWLTEVFPDIENHLVAYGACINAYLPEDLQGDMDLQARCMLVKKADVLRVEAIVRGYLTGSGLKDYNGTGVVCGFELPEGLHDGSKLPKTLFTPSTKADAGEHDENIDFDEMIQILGGDQVLAQNVCSLAIDIYTRGNAKANECGIVIADTKFEFGMVHDEEGAGWILTLVDEVLTPDSSRFWPFQKEYLEAPKSFDKQGLRDWGQTVGIKNRPTLIPPDEVLDFTAEQYGKLLELLTGMNLETFKQLKMRIVAAG